MAPERRPQSRIEFPDDLEIVLTREFDAPIQLVFDVLTKPEHLRKTIAPYGEEVKTCSVDLRVGGDYHFVFVTEDGREMSFRGTFLEVEPRPGPSRRGCSRGGPAWRPSRPWNCARLTERRS